jgi:hypothetical protein
MNADTLRQLIGNCRKTKVRTLGFPIKWVPNQIRNPEENGDYFTDAGAWEFIAAKLEAGHPFEEISLKKPPGALAMVMKIQLEIGVPLLYVKIQVGSRNNPIGRSFHYSEPNQFAE